jgi:hypothetical protein
MSGEIIPFKEPRALAGLADPAGAAKAGCSNFRHLGEI